MFGCPCAFANGNMFAGLFQEVVFARLPPALHAALAAAGDLRTFEPRPSFRMRAYSELPASVVEDEARLAEVLRAAFVFTSALPPKVRKPRKARTPR